MRCGAVRVTHGWRRLALRTWGPDLLHGAATMHASFSFTLHAGPVGRPTGEGPAPSQPSAHRGAGQLWFFGLTAMTLFFAALLILAQLTRGGSIAASVTPILSVYAIGIAVLGVGALAYVVHSARAQGLLASEKHVGDAVAAGPGLRVAPTVPPRGRPPLLQASQVPLQASQASVGQSSVGLPSGQTPRASAPIAVASLHVEPAVAPAPTAARSSTARRTAVHTIRMPKPAVADSTAPHPYPFPASRIEPVALQVRVAGMRSAAWGPRPPSLVDRLLGRGTHRSYPPQERRPGSVRPMPTAGPMSPASTTAPTTPPPPAVLAHR